MPEDETINFRKATGKDVSKIVKLIADDASGKREKTFLYPFQKRTIWHSKISILTKTKKLIVLENNMA